MSQHLASADNTGGSLAIVSEHRSPTSGVRVEVLEHQGLSGSRSVHAAQALHYASATGLTLKRVRLTLNNAAVVLEAGSLHYMHGAIEVTNASGGISGALKKRMTSSLTGEGAYNPTYSGTGTIYLEPAFGHFMVVHLNNEEFIVDRGLFYACDKGVELSAAMQKSISAALAGGEGLFQTRLSGTGLVVLAVPVDPAEIERVRLEGSTLQVDGNFALARKGDITFTVERSSKSIMGSVRSGEGLLQTFRGTGEVWLAPTQAVYRRLDSLFGLSGVTGAQNSSGSNASSSPGLLGRLLGLG
ncbi:MAG: AIM24 family protein [Myxococcota bacterium]